jgi:hypothetical protein
MASVTRTTSPADAITIIEREVREAEGERRAISRQELAELVHASTGIPTAEAFTMVDRYCDEHAPAVPHYLAEEFAIPWLKGVAVLNIAIAIGFYYWGIKLARLGQPGWPYLVAGTIFLGLSALAWVKSIERYAERRAKKRA